jgi:hypothetical protein
VAVVLCRDGRRPATASQRASGRPFDDLAADYPFVRLGDLISLAFCTGSTDVQTFGDGPSGCPARAWPSRQTHLAGATIPVAITARMIHQHAFGSDAELHDALRHASSTIVRGEVAGSRLERPSREPAPAPSG